MTRFRDVVDWVEGRLDERAAARVAADVARDPDLAEAAAFVRRVGAAAAASEAPPASLREDLRRRFSLLRPSRPPLVERVPAVLVLDSAAPGLAGVRGGAVEERHLVLEGAGVDLAVDVHAEDGLRAVEGQVLVERGTPAAAVRLLSADGREVAVTGTDEDGAFALAPVPPGSYLLEVTSTGPVVEAPLELE